MNNFLKQTGVISKFGKYIPTVGPAVSTVASALGYGITGYGDAGVHWTTQEVCLTYMVDNVYQDLPLQVSISLINNQKKPFWEKDCLIF